MRIIADWQYRYIERCLYAFEQLKHSELLTEMVMVEAIESALTYFAGTSHEVMMRSFYFEAKKHRARFTNAGHYRWVCESLLHTEEPNGYVIRREIVYRIAMNCYALKLFQMLTKNDQIA